MTKEIKSLKDLKQDRKNANKGTAAGAQLIRQSLEEVGPWRSIGVDAKGVIGVGNKTGQTWQQLADPEDVIVVQTTGDKLVVVQRVDLDLESDDPDVREKSVKAAILDNRAGEVNLEWELKVLKENWDDLALAELFDVNTVFTVNEQLAMRTAAFLETGVRPSETPETTNLHGAYILPGQTQPDTPVATAGAPTAPAMPSTLAPSERPDILQGSSPTSPQIPHTDLPTAPHTHLDNKGDATSAYTVCSFATSLRQRDYILGVLNKVRLDNDLENTTAALLWLCGEYIGEHFE